MEKFLKLVAEMREAQRQYFRFAKAGSTDQKNKYLERSKQLEKQVDEIIETEKKAQLNLF
jgi:hypothetical protein